jgi:hypothetical protein
MVAACVLFKLEACIWLWPSLCIWLMTICVPGERTRTEKNQLWFQRGQISKWKRRTVAKGTKHLLAHTRPHRWSLWDEAQLEPSVESERVEIRALPTKVQPGCCWSLASEVEETSGQASQLRAVRPATKNTHALGRTNGGGSPACRVSLHRVPSLSGVSEVGPPLSAGPARPPPCLATARANRVGQTPERRLGV